MLLFSLLHSDIERERSTAYCRENAHNRIHGRAGAFCALSGEWRSYCLKSRYEPAWSRSGALAGKECVPRELKAASLQIMSRYFARRAGDRAERSML